jgi:hypothetical protein
MIGDDDLDAAVAAGLLSPELRANLVAFAASRRETKTAGAMTAPQGKFDPVHVLYCAGALLVMGAMGLFANVAFAGLGGWALAAIAIVYTVAFLWLGKVLWAKHATRLPGGLCVAVAVSMAPLAIYGIQDALGLWAAQKPGGYQDFSPLINGSWVYMEIGAVVAAALALLRFPFFWIHLFSAMTLWGAITSGAGGEFSKALYCAFNIVFIALGLFLDRRVSAMFGAIGLTIYLGHLAFDVFKDVLAFSFALSAITLAIIFAGVFVERRRHAFGMLIDAYLPEVLRALRPPRARHA